MGETKRAIEEYLTAVLKEISNKNGDDSSCLASAIIQQFPNMMMQKLYKR
ncbi:hypothetical protein [Sinanaerobacter chloroacetimidivorans]|uniref:Uncharacterized protein n=1 Tax=Sinanaerobacter chloroacetimidivorans TaxID=2818044 RepID=A0A8J7W1E6_9FIRM|nr:hypothetical protein [Sinanaerobacter chloroacetimidivorans]MBR0599052.1 hypothetical protein [Sinanaerobacter chloroacetimidivorans]